VKRTIIAPGNVIESLDDADVAGHLDRAVRQIIQEQARGVGTCRFFDSGTVAGAAVQIPAVGRDVFGPRDGFAWLVTVVRAQGLAAGDVLSLWRNSTADPKNFLDQVTAAAPVTKFSGKSLILHGGERLIFTGTGLAAVGDIVVNGEGQEVGEPDLYKLL
jgi:hypothetical protein